MYKFIFSSIASNCIHLNYEQLYISNLILEKIVRFINKTLNPMYHRFQDIYYFMNFFYAGFKVPIFAKMASRIQAEMSTGNATWWMSKSATANLCSLWWCLSTWDSFRYKLSLCVKYSFILNISYIFENVKFTIISLYIFYFNYFWFRYTNFCFSIISNQMYPF